MLTLRSSQINRVQNSASLILGPGFPQEWFPSQFNRGSIEKLQALLGAHFTAAGKEYHVIAPILFPKGPKIKKAGIFMNPALIRVSKLYYLVSTTRTDTVQVLKVMLFGPTSISDDKPCSGPKLYGIKWNLTETTPGAIALAAVVVRNPLITGSFAHTD